MFDKAKWFTIYANMVNSDLRQEALKLREANAKLETELKAAEDHAATMEHCAKERVPFESVQEVCKYVDDVDIALHCNNKCSQACTAETCPLIPREV